MHIVYGTWGYQPTEEEERKQLKKSKAHLEEFIERESNKPNCCDMTLRYFRSVLAKQARAKGFNVKWWPCRTRDAWLAVGEAARTDQMVPGAVAVLCHSWSSPKYERECVPAWDFYPVLNELMSKHDMIYPHPKLDQLHSEKRYSSSLMAPTRFVHFLHGPNGWKVRGHGDREVGKVVAEELKKLEGQATAKGLSFQDVMVKQGLSWAGEAVTRQTPAKVPDFLTQKMLPKLPEAAKRITVLLQAKLEIVSELRWCVVNGEPRSKEWKSLNEPKRGQLAADADYQVAEHARKQVARFAKDNLIHLPGFAPAKYTIDELEDTMSHLVKRVNGEIMADAGGEQPLYCRVDLLLDRQGRVWLGERESWGADLNGNDLTLRMDPTYKELATKMVAGAKQRLRKLRMTKLMKKGAGRKFRAMTHRFNSAKRKLAKPISTTLKKSAMSSTSARSKRLSIHQVGAHGGA